MGSSRVDEQMAIVAAMLKAIADDVRQLRRAVETGIAAHARHVARTSDAPDIWAGTKCAHCGNGARWIVDHVALCGKCAIRATTAHKELTHGG
jgi:hypothetical protein